MRATIPIEVIRNADQAAALLQPMRLRILEALAEPDSAAGLARRFAMPRQKVNYHLRELEKECLVELVEERRKGNCTERVVRAVARTYLISPEVLGRLASSPETGQDRFSSAYLVSVAARAICEVAALREGARKTGKRLATLTLEADIRFASPEARTAFAEELATALARLATKYHNENVPGGRPHRVFVGAHPALSRPGGPARAGAATASKERS